MKPICKAQAAAHQIETEATQTQVRMLSQMQLILVTSVHNQQLTTSWNLQTATSRS